MSTGLYVLLAAVVLALGLGLYRAMTDGRFRGTHRVRGVDDIERSPAPSPSSVLAGTPWAADLGPTATLLQFSSAFCAPCRATRRILADVAAANDGVVHVEVDAEQHLDLVRRLGILRTPTTLVLDEAGHETVRAQGAPRTEQVLAAIGAAAGSGRSPG